MSEIENLKFVDAFIPDLNGVLRGKRLPGSSIGKLRGEGIQLPNSVFSTEIAGATVGLAELGLEDGDPDYSCSLVQHTLIESPWEPGAGQAMFRMLDNNNEGFFADPQTVLEKILVGFARRRLKPVLALELEFYLTRIVDERSEPALPNSPVSGGQQSDINVYGMTEVWDFRDFLGDVSRYCDQQGIDASAASSEYAPGQFEINLNHTDNPMLACAHAIMLKNVVRHTAVRHGYCATFMPKPFANRTGNGCHIHLSLLDEHGVNVFAGDDETGSMMLHQSIAGLLETMTDFTAVFAPGANSYRRFVPDSYAPTQLSWGVNNRTVAIRIPRSDHKARRLEHRVAGADANPWLLCAAVLGGVLHGMNKQLVPPAAETGDAYARNLDRLPDNWKQALAEFSESKVTRNILGDEFVHLYHGVKQYERAEFEKIITPTDYQWYLRRV